jgi:hypothetical protein
VTVPDLLAGLDPLDFSTHRLAFSPDPVQAHVLASTSARLILNCTRQWGKSTISAARAIHRAFSCPDSLVLVLSPSLRQSAEFLRKAAAFIRQLDIQPRGDGDNEVSLLFPNGSRLVGLPGQEATIRGFSAVNLLLIDEAARVPDDIYKAVRPMLAVANGDLWLLSTPNGRQGFGGDAWERFRVPATECPRISALHLAEERRILGERWFDQEYLCQFTDNHQQFIPQQFLDQSLTEDLPPLFPQGRGFWPR